MKIYYQIGLKEAISQFQRNFEQAKIISRLTYVILIKGNNGKLEVEIVLMKIERKIYGVRIH